MARKVHKSTDKLSADAVRLMLSGFRANKTYAAIARDLAEIGSEVPERTIARRYAEFRADELRRRQTREYVDALLGAAKENPDASEVLGALATETLLTDPDAFAAADPVKMQRLNLQAEKLQIERQKLEIQRAQVKAEERRIALLEAREKRMIEALTGQSTEQLTPEERLKRAMEAWGLK